MGEASCLWIEGRTAAPSGDESIAFAAGFPGKQKGLVDEPRATGVEGIDFLRSEARVSSGDLGGQGMRSVAPLPAPTDGPPAAAGAPGTPEPSLRAEKRKRQDAEER